MGVFRIENDRVILNIPYCEFYIPQTYFDSTKEFAVDYSDHVRALGVFPVGIFKNGKLAEIKNLNAPALIDFKCYDREWKNIEIVPGSPEKVLALKYLKDADICSSLIVQDVQNGEMFLNAILGGALPNSIPYSKIINMWRKNQTMNGINFGVASSLLELIISVVCRDKNNPENKFAKVFGKNLAISDYDYKMLNIRQICQYTSTFTSIIYEDIDSMITSSVNRARSGKEEKESPIEKVIKM